MKKSLIIIFLILFFDQALKFWVKTTMFIGQEHHVFGNWFIIHFTENNGMAFGLEFAGNIGKLFLTLFRVIVAIAGMWYLHKLIKQKVHPGLIISGSLILAGAIGNILDSVFYGLLFSESTHQLATLFPAQGGYAALFYGKVVDMLYFPLIEGHFPSWFPFWANEDFIFFRPVFNIADSSISIGVALILLFQKKFFPPAIALQEQPENTAATEQMPVN